MVECRKIFLIVFYLSHNVVESLEVNIIGMVLFVCHIGTPLCHWPNCIHGFLWLTLIINCTDHFEWIHFWKIFTIIPQLKPIKFFAYHKTGGLQRISVYVIERVYLIVLYVLYKYYICTIYILYIYTIYILYLYYINNIYILY